MRRVLLIGTILLMSAAMWIASAITLRASWRLTRELERAAPLAAIGPHPQSTVVFDRQDHPIFSFYVEQRTDVGLAELSPRMIDALLSVEDRRFSSLRGLDEVRTGKASGHTSRSARIVAGGRTL